MNQHIDSLFRHSKFSEYACYPLYHLLCLFLTEIFPDMRVYDRHSGIYFR